MMHFYDYICTNGHETRAGVSAKYCAICGAEMERQKLGLTDHQRWVLNEAGDILRKYGRWYDAGRLDELAAK